MRGLCVVVTVLAAGCPLPEVDGGADAGPDRYAGYGEPIDAPADEWSYVDVEGAYCGDGSPLGVGINPHEGATRVLLYLEGGGLCWDDVTCDSDGTARFVRRGFNSADMQTFASELGQRGVFDREEQQNPFREAHFVYVAYCTGDLHAGSREENDYGVKHVGYDNLGAFLHRVVPTFPGADDVVLAGISAGGYGALLNYDRVKLAFIDLPVHLLLDSSPPFSSSLIASQWQDVQREAWNLDEVAPDGCEGVCEDLYTTFQFLLGKHPDMRVGLISSLEDATMRYLFGLGAGRTVSGAEYTQELIALYDEIFSQTARTRMYLLPGTQHTWLYTDPIGGIVTSGTGLDEWVRGLVGDDDTWNHVIP